MKFATFLSSTVIFFSSCSSVYAENPNFYLSSNENNQTTQNNISLEDLEAENLLLLVIADSEVQNLQVDRSVLYLKLYEQRGGNNSYAIQYLNSLNSNGQFEKAISESERLTLKSDDAVREVAKAYFNLENYGMALDVISRIINKDSIDYAFLADIHLKLRDIDTALINLNEAYKQSGSKQFVMAIARIQHIYLRNSDEAIKLLENHNKIYSFDVDVARYLAEVYRDVAKHNESLQIYKKLYSENDDQNIANEIAELMSILSLHDDLIKFLKSSGSNDIYLLRLYLDKKMYEEGFQLSNKLYSETGDGEFLAQNAIFEYELNKKAGLKDHIFLPRVVAKLEKVVHKLKDSTFYNYLGYLMIDHNYRVKDGMKYIREAIKLEPDSPYIIDSLAWGEYKLGNCKEAKKNMELVVNKIGKEEPEIKDHWEKINSCK